MCLTDGQADSYRCNLSVYSLHIFLLHIFLPMVLFVCMHVSVLFLFAKLVFLTPSFLAFPVSDYLWAN